MAGIALSFRNYSLEKPPSVSEMIDFANALQLLGTDHVTEEHRDVLLPFLAKTEKDRRHLLLREGFKSLLDDGPDSRRIWHSVEGQHHDLDSSSAFDLLTVLPSGRPILRRRQDL